MAVMTDRERLASIETTLERLDHTLNGNGQPGLAHKLETFITEQYRLGDELKRCRQDLAAHVAAHGEGKSDWKWVVMMVLAAATIAVAIYK